MRPSITVPPFRLGEPESMKEFLTYEWKENVVYSVYVATSQESDVAIVQKKLEDICSPRITFWQFQLYDCKGSSLPEYRNIINLLGAFNTTWLLVNFDLGAYEGIKWGRIRRVILCYSKNPYNKWPETILGTCIQDIGTIQSFNNKIEHPVDLVDVAEMIRANNDIPKIPEPTRAGFLIRKQRHIIRAASKARLCGYMSLRFWKIPKEICRKILSYSCNSDWIETCPLEEEPQWARDIVEHYQFLKKTQEEMTRAQKCFNVAVTAQNKVEEELQRHIHETEQARKRLRGAEEFQVAQKKLLKIILESQK